MRATLDIADDILLAAKELAKGRGTSVGAVISELARESLTRHAPIEEEDGIPLFPVQSNSGVVTREIVNRLRDDTP